MEETTCKLTVLCLNLNEDTLSLMDSTRITSKFTTGSFSHMKISLNGCLTEMIESILDATNHTSDGENSLSHWPAKRHAYAQSGDNGFTPVERELIFDVDITDYDDVRYCCSGADVCLDCWPLITVAIKVIDVSLRVDFGFNHILWVYSGRRGVHCWVCDGKARRLNDEQRASIANYLYLYKGNENSHKKVSLMDGPMHPFVIRSSKISEKHFKEKLVSSQNLFSNEERFEKILEMIPDESVTSELRGAWQESRRSSNLNGAINVSRWELLKCKLQSRKHKGLRKFVEEIALSYAYPRLDMEVSKQMNHLLKAPFCVHPKTGHVCVPIDPNLCEEFDPTSVPTLSKQIARC